MSAVVLQTVVARRVQIRGIVQGVGFRPFVYKLAKELGITGSVHNSSAGVSIHAKGDEASLDQFERRLQDEAPTLARISEFTSKPAEPFTASDFVIVESVAEAGEFVLVSPDVATCDDCWREILDTTNRRFGYPFTNCTNCGPRYSIIKDIPYDRAKTSMAGFKMCPDCDREYHDPLNRRFHAQPNACAECGPTINLAKDVQKQPLFGLGHLALPIMRDLRRFLHDGAIVAIRGLGGYHLACDATNETAVTKLRERKKRSDKPFAVMVRDIEAGEDLCHVSEAERAILLSPEHPIVILDRRPGAPLAKQIAPGNRTVGVMLPYTPLQWFLFGKDPERAPEFQALVMTSGNISDEPIVTSNDEALKRMHSVADWFLLHNREIYMRTDDSVARVYAGRARVLRRSRGYAPRSIDLGRPLQELLACGAELKNTLCVTKGHYAIPSQHIGDVDNLETLAFFEETLENLKKLFRVEPRAVAFDMHPLYLTSKFARGLSGLRQIEVQHHHAHIASCMAENGLEGKVIGVALDGTGYGTDGKIWGGEVLIADCDEFERAAHLRYIPLAGGDKAVRQGWRSALGWLHETFGSELPVLPSFSRVGIGEAAVVNRMIENSINTTETSSAGRLFDAVAAIIGVRMESNFEGQAAIELETLVDPDVEARYPFEIQRGNPLLLDLRPTIAAIVKDVNDRCSATWIASCFHNTVAAAIVETCRSVRAFSGLSRVCLSGGTFQNVRLVERLVPMLEREGFTPFLHSIVPPNDGGISLGQAVIANARLRKDG